jgi:hypothetical protein
MTLRGPAIAAAAEVAIAGGAPWLFIKAGAIAAATRPARFQAEWIPATRKTRQPLSQGLFGRKIHNPRRRA